MIGLREWSHFFASRISASAARTVVNALIVDSDQEPKGPHSRRKPGSTHPPPLRSPGGSRLSPGMRNYWVVSFLCLAHFGERGAHCRECAHRRLWPRTKQIAFPAKAGTHFAARA